MGKHWENRVYEFEDFRLDAAHLLLYRLEAEVSLPPKAIETLLALLQHPGEVVGKHELMQTIWPDTAVEESNLAQYLHVLRKTLGKRSDGKQFIETLKRRGYRFNGNVTVSDAASVPPVQMRNAATVVEREAKSFDQGHRVVERRGNVLTLVDWQETKDDAAEQPRADQATVEPPQRSFFTPRVLLATAFAAVGILLLSVLLMWFNSSTKARKVEARAELTFMNLTNGEQVEFATIAPDGNYFVYTSQEDNLAHMWLQQTGQANRIEILNPFPGVIYGTTFTPDSKFIYFVASENDAELYSLYRVPTMGGVRTKVMSNVASPVSVSPDGSEIAFVRWDQKAGRSSIIIASSDGMKERVVLTRSDDESLTTAAWSPDGKLLAYAAVEMKGNEGQCTIAGLDLQSGETKSLSPEKWDTCFRMAWTHDSQGLVFVGTKFREAYSTRRDQVFYLSVADGQARRLTTAGSRHQWASIGVTDRDEILVVPFNRSSQIWSMDANGDSRTSVQITTGQADGRGGIDTLANSTVAYLTRNGDGFSIWTTNSDGTGRKQVTTEPPMIESLHAARNGRFFVFAAKLENGRHLYRVDASGANLKQLTSGDSMEIDSDISPEGDWVVYGSKVFNGTYGKLALWKVHSDGGEPIRLADVDCVAPQFSPDGKSISCVAEDWKSIFIVSADDGTTRARFEPGKNAVLDPGAKWTADGEKLAYIVYAKNVGNVWVQPINGAPRYQLTDYTSGDIYNFAFGVADSRLYLARGHSIRNAILISNFR